MISLVSQTELHSQVWFESWVQYTNNKTTQAFTEVKEDKTLSRRAASPYGMTGLTIQYPVNRNWNSAQRKDSIFPSSKLELAVHLQLGIMLKKQKSYHHLQITSAYKHEQAYLPKVSGADVAMGMVTV